MFADYLTSLIRQNIKHEPTPGQNKIMEKLADFIINHHENSIFLVQGFAGTGKTTLIGALVRALDELKIKTLLLAPTGRAAKVFSGYAGRQAYTIHRKIYRQKSSQDGFGEFELAKNFSGFQVVIVDEASMISDTIQEAGAFGNGRLLADLVTFVKDSAKCRLILIGDTAQLPPVGLTISPALDKNELALYMSVAGHEILTDVVRQSRNSGILQNATIVRAYIDQGRLAIPKIIKKSFGDIMHIGAHEMPEFLERTYNRFGMEDVIVVCRSNKRTNQYNAGIRKSVLFREDELTTGDLLMVVKNNYHWFSGNDEIDFIANGDIVQVVKIIKYTDRYGFRFAFAKLHMIDYQIDFEAWVMIDTLASDASAPRKEHNDKLFYGVLEDFAHVESRKKQYQYVKEDPFYNALQVKYAYAITCHKAQGGQWKAVFIDQGYLQADRIDMEYLRWLYTAITRATHELYFVNFPQE
jgi:exodeoxyribonuclease V